MRFIIRALRMMQRSTVHHQNYHPGSRPGGRPGGPAAGRPARRPGGRPGGRPNGRFFFFFFVVFVCVWQHTHSAPREPNYRLSSGPGRQKTTNSSSQMKNHPGGPDDNHRYHPDLAEIIRTWCIIRTLRPGLQCVQFVQCVQCVLT